MKETITILTILLLAVFMIGCENAINPIKSQNDNEGMSLAKKGGIKPDKPNKDCATIPHGEIYFLIPGIYNYGETIPVGFNVFGFNYQAQLFNGIEANIYAMRDGYPPYEGDDEAYLTENPTAQDEKWWSWRTRQAKIKWNDAWVDNKDCDRDGYLDRHVGFDDYIGSGARQEYISYAPNQVTYVREVEAAPSGAILIDKIWYSEDGLTEIGPLWIVNDEKYKDQFVLMLLE